jgi:hypothetical protein
VPGLPGESFDFTIYLNADDDVASGIPVLAQVAQRAGLSARLASLELMLYPVNGTGSATARGGQLLGTVSSGLGAAKGTWKLPNSTLPVVLFYWNSNRVVPVRVTTLSVTETLYDEDLNPRQAQAQLGLRVLTPEELAAANPAPHHLHRPGRGRLQPDARHPPPPGGGERRRPRQLDHFAAPALAERSR